MALRPRGALGMRALGALAMNVRERLYGGKCPCGLKSKKKWESYVDFLIRHHFLKYDVIKGLADAYVEEHGPFEKMTETNTPADYLNLKMFVRWSIGQTISNLDARRDEAKARPGYKPGGGVETIKTGLREMAYQRELLEARRKKLLDE